MDGISNETLMKYMSEVTNRVEKKIAEMLPKIFLAHLMVGHECRQRDKVCGVFAIFFSRESTGYTDCLLRFPHLIDTRTGWMQLQSQNFLVFDLSVFSKSIDNGFRLIEDNCPTKKAFLRLLVKDHSSSVIVIYLTLPYKI